MLHILCFLFSSRCLLFHSVIFFGSCNIHILNTECAKILKKISAPKDSATVLKDAWLYKSIFFHDVIFGTRGVGVLAHIGDVLCLPGHSVVLVTPEALCSVPQ